MDNENKDVFQIKKNFIGMALFILIVLVLIDVILRLAPESLQPGVFPQGTGMTAVGHHHKFPDGASFYIYTIFESDGDVYQCWYDEKKWNQKKVTNYKGPTAHE